MGTLLFRPHNARISLIALTWKTSAAKNITGVARKKSAHSARVSAPAHISASKNNRVGLEEGTKLVQTTLMRKVGIATMKLRRNLRSRRRRSRSCIARDRSSIVGGWYIVASNWLLMP